ncbi:uncharacterized protein LOC109709225 isoform X1 [Ananas comosus]|uniref:Uncharacterized protein LOC109709225 isoform X1 n=2 Tax=Ananas comosus TaxID=4615 RepID=A0A6P5ETW5_ANACO|nr:uncharacterized protein LOC109709225 isoform X1 [Ananas comosus]XP_020086927.1 uncharacterized protein LOC109709225 isoform X1 [Ananas comosus]
MSSLVRRTLIFPETRVSSPKSPQCSIASCSPPISPRQKILSDHELHPPPKKKQKHWAPCVSDKPFPCSPSRSHSHEVLDEGHVDGARRKRTKIRLFQNRFFKGDVVWAKAFPYTWWPGWVGRIEGSFAWVSFYGCKKSRRFRVSEICGFEEGYDRMSKMGGVKLADEINLALEDLSRRTVIALTSCCWVSPVESSGVSADHISGVRERFDSREVLRFVNDLGVSACVADKETARVVRFSAQVYAYRSYASTCRRSAVAGDFSVADMLEFARDFAVLLFIDGVDDSVVSAELDRFNEFRRFVSVFPRWMYQQRVELEEAFPFDESVGKEDLSDLSSESETVYGGIVEPEDELDDNILDLEFEITQQQELEVLEGPEVCMLNRADYAFLDMDEEYESLPNCLEVAVEQSNSTWKDISVDQTFELETSFTRMPLREVDFGTTCNKNIPSADDGSVFHAHEQASVHLSCYKDDNLPENVEDIINSSDIPLSRIVAYDSISLSNLGSEKGEEKDDIAMNIKHGNDDSSAEQRFSVDFPTDETQYSDKEIKFAGAQSSSDVCCVVQDGVPRGVIDNSSTLASPTKALSPNSIERRRDNLINNFFKLHKSLVPYSEALSYAKVFVEYVTSTGYDTRSYDGSITGNNTNEKRAVLAAGSEHCSPSGANKGDKRNGFCSLTLPNCASSYKIRRKKKHDKLISSGSSKWTRFYSSPMMRERSNPTSRTKKSSSISRLPTSPKSLHMKFPKDFKMPSKEELEKRFRVFGRLDRSRTKLFFYTGAAQVVFLRNTDADAAYRYVKQKSIFDCANVRFWFDEHEKFRMRPSSNDHVIPEKEVLSSLNHTPSHECIDVVQKEDNRKILCRGDSHKSTSPNVGHSPSNLKSCLKIPDTRDGDNSKKACKVRFKIETSIGCS